MTLRQIFGYTQPEQAPPGKWVKFIAASESDDKDEINISVRGDDCVFKAMSMPGDVALDLAFKIILSCRNRDRREAGLEPLTNLLRDPALDIIT